MRVSWLYSRALQPLITFLVQDHQPQLGQELQLTTVYFKISQLMDKDGL